MVSLRYASLAQIAAELRRRVYGERTRLAGIGSIPFNPTLGLDRPKLLAAVAEELQKLADEEREG